MHQLTYGFINRAGRDISDLIRGKLEALDEILNFKTVFDKLDKAEETVKEVGVN